MQIRKHLESFGQSRRWFMQIGAASVFASRLGAQAAEAGENVFGPRPGYSPQIGTLVSEMIWMRGAVLATVKGLNQNQLDFLLDNKANRIGALLLHLAATERLYQLNTFENVPAQELDKTPAFRDWDVAMELGEPARQVVSGVRTRIASHRPNRDAQEQSGRQAAERRLTVDLLIRAAQPTR